MSEGLHANVLRRQHMLAAMQLSTDMQQHQSLLWHFTWKAALQLLRRPDTTCCKMTAWLRQIMIAVKAVYPEFSSQ